MSESIHIRLLGASFSIQTDQEPAYVESLLEFIEEKARQIERSAGSQDSLKTAILVSLLTADELFHARTASESTEQYRRIGEITERLIERIDSVLDDDSQ